MIHDQLTLNSHFKAKKPFVNYTKEKKKKPFGDLGNCHFMFNNFLFRLGYRPLINCIMVGYSSAILAMDDDESPPFAFLSPCAGYQEVFG